MVYFQPPQSNAVAVDYCLGVKHRYVEYFRVNSLSTHQILSFLRAQNSVCYRDSIYIIQIELNAQVTSFHYQLTPSQPYTTPTILREEILGINGYLNMESSLIISLIFSGNFLVKSLYELSADVYRNVLHASLCHTFNFYPDLSFPKNYRHALLQSQAQVSQYYLICTFTFL